MNPVSAVELVEQNLCPKNKLIMKYHLLGKLPLDSVEFFKREILKRKSSNIPYQWIQFDEYLNGEFLKIFTNCELKIQISADGLRPIQKAFYSDPGHGFRIHKDGLRCQSALNIAVSCNPDDWVRWYDEDYINDRYQSVTKTNVFKAKGSSRDVVIEEYETVPYVEELHNQIGDVYVLDVDSYHSFKCNGDEPRIVIQTKFDGFPKLEAIYNSLSKNSFSNLIK